ncbi:MAG: hypothetical protein QM692_04555 [Thermomicrobiales bacterium]
MDDRHFDLLTRSLTPGATRRTLAQRLGVASILGGLSLLAAPDADAKRRKKKGKGKKKKKKTGATCPPCPAGQQCVNGACTAACRPRCNAQDCGAADGCGGICTAGLCPVCARCVDGVCEQILDGDPCDNGNLCEISQCANGACVAIGSIICPEPNPCRLATCVPETGQCEATNLPAGEACFPTEVCRVAPGVCNAAQVCLSDPVVCPSQDDECCLSGPGQGECRGSGGTVCGTDADCCSDSCAGSGFCD